MKPIVKTINSAQEMQKFAADFAANLKGGEVIELIGDVGAGKTTFTKGLASGLGIKDNVQSPSFTISRVYDDGRLRLAHYDFYRLNEPGLMVAELTENLEDKESVVVVEWAQSVSDILPKTAIKIKIEAMGESQRSVNVSGTKEG